MTDQWMTQKQAAEYLGVTDRTIRNFIRRGDLAAFRVQGSRIIRIKASDIEALLRPIPTA